jgi:hypothetical protein
MENNMNKTLLIDQKLLQAIHDYLIARPMREVEGLVMAIREVPEANSHDTRRDDGKNGA